VRSTPPTRFVRSSRCGFGSRILIDIVLVSDAEQIAWLNEHPAVARSIDPTRSCCIVCSISASARI